jgi:mono/diheme cytochrome c family protein
MTRASILTFALLVASCSKEGAKGAPRGEVVYSSLGCAMCHGGGGEGTALGPSLAGAKSRWEKPSLVAYFKNPAEYAAKDPRLSEQAKKYSVPMPNYEKQPVAELEALADFVLSR